MTRQGARRVRSYRRRGADRAWGCHYLRSEGNAAVVQEGDVVDAETGGIAIGATTRVVI